MSNQVRFSVDIIDTDEILGRNVRVVGGYGAYLLLVAECSRARLEVDARVSPHGSRRPEPIGVHIKYNINLAKIRQNEIGTYKVDSSWTRITNILKHSPFVTHVPFHHEQNMILIYLPT